MVRLKFLSFLVTIFLPVLSFANNSIIIPQIKPGEPLPANLFIQIAKKINPSVVNISTTVRMNSLSNQNIFDMFLFPHSWPQSGPRPAHSLGSGFILESDGHIVTNAHVINKADTIRVQIKDDPTVYKAKVIGKDSATDIALIKINAKESRTRKNFPIVTLGDSNALQVGEWVAAFGNPYGHSNTMTKGIISAIDRHIDELNLLPFLQTDASINPGNSGGPLVNTQGQVIGVNTAINPRAQNIGFAIPIYNVKSILKVLKKHGYVKRGFLGVQMSTTPIEFDYKNKSYSGVLIVDVVREGPASKGGLRPQDIITEFNGSPVKSSRDLANIVSATPVNEKVQGKLFRNQKMRTFTVVIKERPRNNIQASNVQKKQSSNKAPFNLGFTLAQSHSEIPKNLNLPLTSASRPIVIKVFSSSPARRAGMKRGDLIFSVNGNNVSSVEDVFKKLSPQRQNILHVLRFTQPGSYNLKKLIIVN